jgi:hypothetical protein
VAVKVNMPVSLTDPETTVNVSVYVPLDVVDGTKMLVVVCPAPLVNFTGTGKPWQ